MKSKTYRRLRAAGYVLITLVLLYTLLGFFVAGPVARRVLCSQLSQLLNRDVQIERIRLNPYALTLHMQGLHIEDSDGSSLLKLGELSADVAALSLFDSEWRIPVVTVGQPFLHVRLNRDGSFNFSDILDAFATESDPTPPADAGEALELLGKPIRVNQLTVMGGRLELDDHSLAEPFSSVADPIEMRLNGLSTARNTKARLEVSTQSDRGAKIATSGTLQLNPFLLTSQLSLTDLIVGSYAPYYERSVGFEISRGTLELEADLLFGLRDEETFGCVTNAQVRLSDVALREKGTTAESVQLESIQIKGASVDLFTHLVSSGSIVLNQGRVEIQREEDGTVNLQRFAATSAPGQTDDTDEPGIENLIRSLHLGGDPPWVVECDQVTLQGWSLSLADASVTPPVQLPIRNLVFSLGPLSTSITNVTTSFALSWETLTNSVFHTEGQFSVVPLQAKVAVDVRELQLGTFKSYLSSLVQLDLQRGELSVKGDGELTFNNRFEPQAKFSGELALADLVLNETVLGENLCSWERIGVTGISAGWNPLQAEIDVITIVSPQARFTMVETNHNLAILLGDTKPVLEVEPEASSPPVAKTPLPPLAIHRVSMTNAHIVFTDRVRDPDVVISLQSLEGELAGLSTDPTANISFRFSGKVDDQAPVSFQGNATPWTTPMTANLETVIKEIDLRPASPYFGQFMGYYLADGNVSLELNSKVEGTQLQVSNQIVLRRLTLGDKTGSPDAPNLPIKFAISMLKDRQGNIELSVPIEGNIDDPTFDVLSAITGQLDDLIKKIATSPFSALGSVFGGDPETLKDQTFAPGNSRIDSDNQEKLKRVAKGLYARPALSVEIRGSVDPEKDGEALRRHKLKEHLLSLQEFDSESQSTIDLLSDETAASSDYASLLAQAYVLAFPDLTNVASLSETNKLAGSLTTVPVSATTPTVDQSASEAETKPRLRAKTPRQKRVAYTQARRDRSQPAEEIDVTPDPLPGSAGTNQLAQVSEPAWQAPPPEVMEQELLQQIEVTEQDLRELASDRVQAVRDALVGAGNVEPDRILSPSSTNTTLNTQGARAFLSLR